jgi:hypothetical protein
VQDQLEAFAERYIRTAVGMDPKTVARVLSDPVSPREALVEAFMEELTGGSLQSVDEIHRVRAALGIVDSKEFIDAINGLRPTFVARNQISHEMDLSPVSERRTRRHRGIQEMVGMANAVMDVGSRLVVSIAGLTEQVAGDGTAS